MENAFIFDDVLLTPKQQIPIHTQNEWELSYIIRGQGTKFLGEETQPFCEGEVILIPPKFPHGWFFDGESTAAERLPIGTVYPVWTGIGAVGAVIVGIVFFHEPATFWRIFFITTLILSIIGLKVLA